MYFDRLHLWERFRAGHVLHFAPEKNLSIRIAQEQPASYIKADFSPSSAEIQKIDVTSIPFPENSFDVIIICHVLEHVPDDGKALSELFRVLKNGGIAVLQTPYSSLLENSFCDPSINTDELRNRFYFQEDHVRVYGRDLFRKIQQAGFILSLERHDNVLKDLSATFYGVNAKEDLILGRKNSPGDQSPPACASGAIMSLHAKDTACATPQ